MRKLLLVLMALPIFIMGCSQEASGLIEYNNSELKKQISKLDLQAMLPSQLPFELAEYSFDAGPSGKESNKVIIDFYGKQNEHLGLVVSSKVNLSSDLEQESVEIGEVKGKYAENENGVNYLMWKDGDTHYTLQYFSEASETVVGKEELVEVAQSFE
jgi:Domain of unknown function (DUF4367)